MSPEKISRGSGYYDALHEEERLEIDSDDLLEEISESMTSSGSVGSFYNNNLSLTNLQSIIDDPQNSNIDQSPESSAKAIKTLRDALSSALMVHQSFVSSTVRKGQSDHRKRVELQRHAKRLEVENRELKGERGEMVRGLSVAKRKEKMLLDELQTMEGTMDSKTSELKIARAKERKSRKLISEYSVEKRKLQTELEKHGKKRSRSIHVAELKSDLFNKKSRIELLESQLKSQEVQFELETNLLNEKLEGCREELLDAETTILELKNREEQNKLDLDMALFDLKEKTKACEKLEQRVSNEQAERVAISAQMVAMTKEQSRVKEELIQANEAAEVKWKEKVMELEKLCDMKDDEIEELRMVNAGLEMEVKVLNDTQNGYTREKQQVTRLSIKVGETTERLKFEEQRMKAAEEKYLQQIKQLEVEVREGQAERRRMHNVIQELRGNVRVFARIRPFLPGDNVQDDASPCVVPRGDNGVKHRLGEDEPWQHNFTLDAVFPPTAGQDTVFQEASEFIQSALDGYNVCLFSYGQTGSGKTHTMQGCGLGQMRGIIPRAIEQVGKCKLKLEHDGWSYEMKVSYLEIYNETIRDLLRDDDCEEDLKHEIKLNKDGRRYVSNLNMKQIDPNDSSSIEKVMQQAATHRSVGSTGMNAVSSRSHAVFTLHLTAVHAEQGQALRGELNLVDLAGSERLKKSNADGDQATETKSINKSLSALTDVFMAIGRKGGHVPYRNSKLTYLLQPCLGGEGKTLMLVNLSPTEASCHESLCSLRFASQVNKCELGKAKRSIGEYVAKTDEVAKGDGLSRPGTSKALAAPRRKNTSTSKQSSRPAGTQRATASKKPPTGSALRIAESRTKNTPRINGPRNTSCNTSSKSPHKGRIRPSSSPHSTASTTVNSRSGKSTSTRFTSTNQKKPPNSKRPSYASVLSQKRIKIDS